jgi:hypothetical protein
MTGIINEKIPMPPIKPDFKYPIEFWSEIVMHLDQKAKVISDDYGWGKINLTLIIQGGKVTQVVFNDEIRVSKLEEKLYPREDIHKPTLDTK